MLYVEYVVFAAAAFALLMPPAEEMSPQEIVKRSVAANEEDWKAAPMFSYEEKDVETKGDSRTARTYEVRMIEGSPYKWLIAVGSHELTPSRQREEEQKEQREIARRSGESQSERESRIRKYQKERAQDHLLMNEMVRAFTFRLLREEPVSGRPAYVLEAEPNPDYKPPSHEAKVLTGMRGTLWVDKAQFHWSKVEAVVFRPVSFARFIAKVEPGTQFLLEQHPVTDHIWQPTRFTVQVVASIMWWQRNSNSDETFSNYRLQTASASSSH
jgi:hypothetical protein